MFSQPRFDPRRILGDRGSVLGKKDVPQFSMKLRAFAGRPGQRGQEGPSQLSPASTAVLLERLNALAKIMTESRLGSVPISVYFYGGLLSTGFDPQAPPAESGAGFTNAILATSNGGNAIPSFTGVEVVRIGQGLDPNVTYPASTGPGILLPGNFPTLPLTYIYPGTVVGMDFSFTTQTQIGKDVVVGSAIAIDSEQRTYFAYPVSRSAVADDFDTYEHHFVHSNAAGGQPAIGGVQLWNDYAKQYAVFTPWNLVWQRNCRCLINNFMTVDTITVREWDVNAVWNPNLKQLTDITKLYQDYPTTMESPAGAS